MATYTEKLARMRDRRLGLESRTSALKAFDYAANFAEAASPLITEAYQYRSKSEQVQYVLGAMQELEPTYTKKTYAEGDRVKNQLSSALAQIGISVDFEYQGSVPLNIHIRAASDIDLLVLHTEFLTFDSTGPAAGRYSPWSGSRLDSMKTLRTQSEISLESRFPAVTVDKSGSKSIALSGGSLQRKVDVVPSHWHDSAEYQRTGQKEDREVCVLDKSTWTLPTNRPFLHISKIETRDVASGGGAKKIIRLLKTLKRDAETEINLTSYDIASLVYHFDTESIRRPAYLELALLVETQRQLAFFVAASDVTKSLMVPDGTRKIFDKDEKWGALLRLKSEVDALVNDVAAELTPHAISVQQALSQYQVPLITLSTF